MYGVVDHIGIAVADLEAALYLYTNVLGLQHVSTERLEHAGIDVTFVRGGEGLIELLAAFRPDSTIGKFLATRGPGMHHVAFRVHNLEAALQDGRAAGLLAVGEVTKGAGGTRTAFFHPRETLGTLIELVQPDESVEHGS